MSRVAVLRFLERCFLKKRDLIDLLVSHFANLDAVSARNTANAALSRCSVNALRDQLGLVQIGAQVAGEKREKNWNSVVFLTAERDARQVPVTAHAPPTDAPSGQDEQRCGETGAVYSDPFTLSKRQCRARRYSRNSIRKSARSSFASISAFHQ